MAQCFNRNSWAWWAKADVARLVEGEVDLPVVNPHGMHWQGAQAHCRPYHAATCAIGVPRPFQQKPSQRVEVTLKMSEKERAQQAIAYIEAKRDAQTDPLCRRSYKLCLIVWRQHLARLG